MKYLHIPKTAGTLFKNCEKLDIQLPFEIVSLHDKAQIKLHSDVCFVIRDPWDRFCSGYWERITNKQRRQLNDLEENKQFRRSGYSNYTDFEKELFELYPTPNDLITGLQTDEHLWNNMCTHKDLNVLLRPLTYFTGTFTEYVNGLEKRVTCVYDQQHLDQIFLQEYNIELPTKPFLTRSRSQFDQPQSYSVSPDNLQWFKEWRTEDYQIIEHIRKQPYFKSINR